MFGFSIFLGSDLTEETENYIEKMSNSGFTGIFSSMHIPEDDQSHYLNRIKRLGELAKKNQLTLMVDISTKGLSTLGIDLEKEASLVKEYGITGLRMDYGISIETIAKVSHALTVGLNASTLSDDDVLELKKHKANFSNMEFWHNYYPRKETGLAKKDYIKQNQWLKTLGGTIVAFTPGDKILRGPLFDHLPTLEKHRDKHPLAASIELIDDCLTDVVYIGDEMILTETIDQFNSYQKEKLILLNCDFLDAEYDSLLKGEHTNRMDVARDVVRSQEARFKQIPYIKQKNTINRTIGCITLDNHLYGRYTGELQLIKKSLTSDSRVNVVGKVRDSDIDLIEWIKPGQKFMFI